jgi:hypothetical protein
MVDELLTIMETETLDDGSVVINFDQIDKDSRETIKQNGYVMVRQETNEFLVTIFNSDGDVISETSLPINFKEC